MTGSRPLLFAQMLLALAFMLITGCGGDGSASPGVISLNQGPTASATLVLQSDTLQLNGSTTATATFLDRNGNPIADLPVTFSTSLGSLTPATGLASTNAAGVASISLGAGGSSGTGIITASARVSGSTISRSATFSVAFPEITISTPVLGLTSLAPGGSTSVTVSLTAGGQPFTTPVDVSFTSNFASSGGATLISPVRTVNGSASSTYKATGGVGTDTITVSVGGTSVTTTLTVASAAASSITFVSATPRNIALRGMGGVGSSENATVVFRVLDVNGQPKAGEKVDFTLNTSLGELKLLSPSGSTATDGTVSTIVQAGVVATPVRVTAAISDSSPKIATQSDQLVVSTGVPAQDGFSVSLSNLNPEAYNVDGVAVGVTARLSDHFHNPVPDGTAVSFSTSGGSIQPSCTTVNGACSVTWTSQNPRPTTPSALRDGRAVIFAYAVGEEFFLDLNGNGLADPEPADDLQDDPEAFRDDNEDGIRQATDGIGLARETFIDFNGNGAFDGPDGQYNGILQGTTFVTSGAPRSKNIFSNSVLVMSTSSASITSSPASITAPTEFTVTVKDLNGNTMPSGTTITVAAPFGVLSGTTSLVVPQNTGAGEILTARIDASAAPADKTGFITITVTSPRGLTTIKQVRITGIF